MELILGSCGVSRNDEVAKIINGRSIVHIMDLCYSYSDDDFDGVYIPGGNTFDDFFIYNQLGLLKKVKELAEKGKLIIGTSAGGILLCPTVLCAQFADVNRFEGIINNFDGLGLFPYLVKPHSEMWLDSYDVFKDFAKEQQKNMFLIPDEAFVYYNDGKITYINNDLVEDIMGKISVIEYEKV